MSDGVGDTNNPKTKKGKKIGDLPKGDANSIGLSSSPLLLMQRGFFPFWRKIVDWGWYKHPVTSRVFFHLLLTVNYKTKDYMGYTILPGQVVTGRIKLSASLNLSEQSVRTALKHLKATNEITIKNYNKFSIITLNNYKKYLKPTSEPTLDQPATNQQLTTTNKGNKDNKDNNIIQPSAAEAALKRVNDSGFNIYSLMGRLRKERKWPKDLILPSEVVINVCNQYFKDKDNIKKPWPWFLKVMGSECKGWMESKKRTGLMPQAIKDIMMSVADKCSAE